MVKFWQQALSLHFGDVIKAEDFLALIRNLLAVIRSVTVFKSELIISCKFSSFSELKHRQVLSANNRGVTDVLLIKS